MACKQLATYLEDYTLRAWQVDLEDEDKDAAQKHQNHPHWRLLFRACLWASGLRRRFSHALMAGELQL